jgi:hypothetical protein
VVFVFVCASRPMRRPVADALTRADNRELAVSSVRLCFSVPLCEGQYAAAQLLFHKKYFAK